ncbi:MAG: restriction endonuclease subunit S [Lamprobacter sp.]|uniref:restriction endonuclease subunit S n=1 Tax=Lamprobacter sp. TaxID=3100796 RepID=UPI002B25E6C9|nr:restriction endonuclease subunit S [Lamprobacter sp.]MEA3642031.1 restriction endonuclease subunit S [Lamprobacter sp.]
MGDDHLLGPIPANWEYTTLGEACRRGGGDIQTGPFGSQLHAADYVPEGIPSIMPQNIGDNRIVEEGIARIRPHDAERLCRYLVREGDIVYSRRGDVERRALVRAHEDGWLCGTGCLRVRLGKNGVEPRYASFYLGHPSVREWIVRHAHGATMANLNTAILSACPFVVPPSREQQAIADILGSLDDKIELNRRMNHILEAMARAIFKAWFVDFEPIKAKVAGATSFCGMPQEIFDQLPGGLTEFDGKLVPNGWSLKATSDIADYVNGRAFTKNATGYGRMVIRIAELNSGPGSATKYSQVNTEPQYTAFPDDILFAWSGSLGVYRWHRDEAIINQHIFKVIPNDRPSWYVYYRLVEAMPFFQAIASTKATTMGHIKRGHLSDAMFVEPPGWFIDAASKQIRPLYDLIHCNERQSITLSALRDALLPKLISGEICVSGGE